MVGDYINIMKTTFKFNFDLYQAFNNMGTQKHENIEELSIKIASLKGGGERTTTNPKVYLMLQSNYLYYYTY